jgi:hypothetical protein
VSHWLSARKTRAGGSIPPVDAHSVGLTEIDLEQIRNAFLPVVEQRLGVTHPIIAYIDAEGGNDPRGFSSLQRIIETFLLLLDNPRDLGRRPRVRRSASDEKIDVIRFGWIAHGLASRHIDRSGSRRRPW